MQLQALAVAAAAAAVAVALLVWARRRDRLTSGPPPGLTLYERPYAYPAYPADTAAVGARCTPYCAVPPCTTWCR
jgi:hypothetical protein